MIIEIKANEKTSFRLTPEQGSQLRELVVQQIDVSFREYCFNKIGMPDSNVSAILLGKRNMTVSMLRRLLSGTRIEVEECILSFTLGNTSGGIVKPAVLPTLEEMLSSQEQNDSAEMLIDDLQEEPLTQERILEIHRGVLKLDSPSPNHSSSSEKPQGKLKTLLASRSWENQDESSESSSED